MPAPDKQSDSQDKTHLTQGGVPGRGEFMPGDIVGGTYQLISFIGAGGMGNVYRVRHTILQTEYALKTLSADKVTEVAWRRFQNEAQSIARMNHPNIVAIYNLGLHDGRLPFYAMDLLQGETLSDRLRSKGHLETNEAIGLFIEICAGIGFAHKKGIVHRDIKPANIVLIDKPDATGARVKIVDFGIAKLSHTKDLANQQLTGVGEICGSPYYMSPEQCESGKIDARSDVYSLGCTLFETLTGSLPFRGRNAVETMLLHNTAAPPTLQAASAGREYPHLLELALAKMLAKAPMDRYQTMEQISQDLHKILNDEDPLPQADRSASSHFSPVMLMSAVVATLLIAALTACWFNGKQQVISTHITPEKSAERDITNSGMSATVRPAPIVDTQPYSHIVTRANGKKYRLFSFPRNDSLGLIRTFITAIKYRCQGDVELPETYTILTAGASIITHPEYLDRFRPDDLGAIELKIDLFTKTEGFTNEVLKHLPRLTGLNALTLKDCSKIDDQGLPYIESLHSLTYFESQDSSITMARLARSPILPGLNTLVLNSQQSLTPVLAALKNSVFLFHLDTGAAKLTHEDYKLIADIPNLSFLTCDNAGMHDEDLVTLSHSKHINNLESADNNLTPRSLPLLSQMVKNQKKAAAILSSRSRGEMEKIREAGEGIK